MPQALPGIKRWPLPASFSGGLGNRQRGRWFMFGDCRCATAFVDLTQWPPKPIVNSTEYAVSFDELPDGRIVVCSMLTHPPGDYAIRIHPANWPTNPNAGTLEEFPNPGGLTLAEVWCVSGQVVAFDTLLQSRNPPSTHKAYLLARGKLIAARGLPPVTSFTRDLQTHQNGKVTLATGEEILIWDGDGYSWTGKGFKRTWELGVKEHGAIDGWVSVPWGEGFFYLSNRRLMFARRGQRPVRFLPDVENILHLSPGPEDSVIVSLGPKSNTQRHVARVWFPDEGTYIPLLRGHLGWGPSTLGEALRWSAATKHLYLSPVETLPDSALLNLDRARPRGKGYQLPKA